MAPHFLMDARGERQRRMNLLILFFLAFFFVLAVRIFFLQIVRGREYQQQARDNSINKEIREAPRGLMFDRNGMLLVDNRPSYSVVFNRVREPVSDDALSTLSESLGLDPGTLKEKIGKRRAFTGEAILLKRNVPFRTVSMLEERKLDFPGVSVIAAPCRHYRHGSIGSHFFGYLGQVSETELEENLRDLGYREGDLTGRTGLEKTYESYLRGENGHRYVRVNAVGQMIGIISDPESNLPVPGDNLHLAVDFEIQELCNALLTGRVGAIVVMDPADGGILAMVSKPEFDPNRFSVGIDSGTWRELNDDPERPLFNRAIQSHYPPGSTYKLVTAIAGLEEKKISIFTTLDPCWGGYQFGRRYFRCWKPAGHGTCNIRRAIIESCNVFFYQLALMMDADILAYYSRKVGFGRKTEVDIPGEGSGLVPDIDWYNRRYGRGKWTRGILLNLGIGQGEILVTPLQMACFYAGLVNGGTLVQPHFLQRIESPRDGAVIHEFESQNEHFVISRGTEEILRKAMIGVVHDEDGTARAARVDDVTVGGKTGTAQYPHGEDHAWFVAIAPMEDPQIVISIIVENAGHGGAKAAPLAGEIIRFWKNRTGL